MKKILLIAALFTGLSSFAQGESDTVKLNINGSEVIIRTDDISKLSTVDLNAIVGKISAEIGRSVAQQQVEMAKIDADLAAGKITEEQADERRDAVTQKMEDDMERLGEMMEVWGEAYGERMEEHGDSIDEYWESWAEQWEEGNMAGPGDSTVTEESIIIDDNGIRIEKEAIKKKKKEHKDYKEHDKAYVDFHYGQNTWIHPDGSMPTGSEELNFWKSNVWTFGMGHKFRFGKTSPFMMKYGLEMNWHRYRFQGGNTVQKISDATTGFDGIVIAQDPINNVNYSKLRIIYLDLPVMFQFDNSRHGMDERFTFGIGGYAGIKLWSNTEIHYNDFNGDKNEVSNYNDYYLNNFRYGLMAQVGWGAFKVTGKYDFNPLFRSNRDTPDYQNMSVSLGFTF